RRQFWVIAHRWAGLTIALFLAVAGFTGIFLAFDDELEGVISPRLFHASAPFNGAQILTAAELRSRVLAHYPGGIIDRTPLHFEPGRS
ncbi:PepSY domain-containing protein, partial [Acinetobacter baumannii]